MNKNIIIVTLLAILELVSKAKYVYSKNDEDKGLGEIIVGKHRNGPTGSVDIAFVDRYAKFENLSRLESDYIHDDLPV